MFVVQMLQYPLRRVTLLFWTILVLSQYLIDNANKGIELRTSAGFAPPLTRRYRMLQYLGDRPPVNAKMQGRLPFAHPVAMTGQPDLPIKLHLVHLPALSPINGIKGVKPAHYCAGTAGRPCRLGGAVFNRNSQSGPQVQRRALPNQDNSRRPPPQPETAMKATTTRIYKHLPAQKCGVLLSPVFPRKCSLVRLEIT